MLLATSDDKTASIWNVPSEPTWPLAPRVAFDEHVDGVVGGAFLTSESHVITGGRDKFLSIWRTSDGMKTTARQCGEEVCHQLPISLLTHFDLQLLSLTFDAGSGFLVLGYKNGLVELKLTPPQIVTAAQAARAREDMLERRAEGKLIKEARQKMVLESQEIMDREAARREAQRGAVPPAEASATAIERQEEIIADVTPPQLIRGLAIQAHRVKVRFRFPSLKVTLV